MSSRGLEGIVAARTTLSHVYGEEGRLIYGGYDIADLAEHATFEETCHLLWFGDLPTSSQLQELKSRLSEGAPVPDAVLDIIRAARPDAHPMSILRTAISALALHDDDAEANSEKANVRKAIRLTARTVTLTAAIDRLRRVLKEEVLARENALADEGRGKSVRTEQQS